jgi:hypothetical protein
MRPSHERDFGPNYGGYGGAYLYHMYGTKPSSTTEDIKNSLYYEVGIHEW